MCPGNVEEQKCRNELKWYAAIPHKYLALNPLSSKLDSIEGELLLMHESSGPEQPPDYVEYNEGVVGLLEDLQESISHYQVCSYPDTFQNIDKDNRPHNKQQSTIKNADRW